MMFNWFQKTASSKEFLELYALIEKQRIKVEMIELEFGLLKKKLKVKNKIEEEEETETNKNPSILLNPNGNPIVSAKSSQ